MLPSHQELISEFVFERLFLPFILLRSMLSEAVHRPLDTTGTCISTLEADVCDMP
jgi:hypothetical protein